MKSSGWELGWVAIIAGVVLLVSCAGALVRPAMRAAATDPAEVLRAE